MKNLIIRDLDEAALIELKRKAWHHGLPLEALLRRLLFANVDDQSDPVERALFLAHAPPSAAGRRGSAPYGRLHS